MYLNHPLVSGFPLTLRYGEERDRDYLAAIFSEVWAEIPEKDRSAILSRGYGHVAVDVLNRHDFVGRSEAGGDIRLQRSKVDSFPRKALRHLVAHELAHKVDEVEYPNLTVRLNEPGRKAQRRLSAILERWGFPAKEKMEYSPADEERRRANIAQAQRQAVTPKDDPTA